MIRVALVGLGKMGISHFSMINAHPDVTVVGICDTSRYLLDVLGKYTGIATYSDCVRMLDETDAQALIISTPTSTHAKIARAALERKIHVFCEKPFGLDAFESETLGRLAEEAGVINQVGYHYKFIGAFQEVKRILDSGALGRISHVLAEAYGPVVLKPKGLSWRTKKEEGGGCVYDYAAHPLNLLNWYFGEVASVQGTVLNKVFSKDTEDEVYATLIYQSGASAQLSVNWSDDSQRKMSVKMTIWGARGKIIADRQECQCYLRDAPEMLPGYHPGWNIRYTTDLTTPVWFYVRGEEYSAQLAYFVECLKAQSCDNLNSFSSAAQTDRAIALLLTDAQSGLAKAAER